MSIFKNVIRQLNNRNVKLSGYFKKEELPPHISDIYEKIETIEIAVLASILNSAFYNKKQYFMLSRRSIEVLLNYDQNHEKDKFRMYPNIYKKVFSFLCNNDIVKLVCLGNGQKASGFEIADKSLIDALGLSEEDRKMQRDVLFQFVTGQGISNKEEVISNKIEEISNKKEDISYKIEAISNKAVSDQEKTTIKTASRFGSKKKPD